MKTKVFKEFFVFLVDVSSNSSNTHWEDKIVTPEAICGYRCPHIVAFRPDPVFVNEVVVVFTFFQEILDESKMVEDCKAPRQTLVVRHMGEVRQDC